MSYPHSLFAGICSLYDLGMRLRKFKDLLASVGDGNDSSARGNALILRVLQSEQPEICRLVLADLREDWILEPFPSASTFVGSLAHHALVQLSLYFQNTTNTTIDNYSRLSDKRPDKRRLLYCQLVKEAPAVLAALSSQLDSLSVGKHDNTIGLEDFPFKKMSQKEMKLSRKHQMVREIPLDPAPFARLELDVPVTALEMEAAMIIVLNMQKWILQDYLEGLRCPELRRSIEETCLPSNSFSAKEVDAATFIEDSDVDSGEVPATASNGEEQDYLEHHVSINTLYADNAAGFGEWMINLSPRAERDLRDRNRRERKIFKIIVKKIKELSNGHFSSDNQKRLNGHQTDVPVYEAKMTGDLRLVYHIDCIPAINSESEQQAIKIFGVYTHAQIGRGSFWDSMGRELGKKGKEYRERCAFRKMPHNPGDYVFSPGIFPAPEESRALPSGNVPDLPPDDLENIQALLIKSVSFSKAMLKAIIADLDIAFVLQVSPTEKAIIEHPDSCYVIGRSGTGKTTTMLYKMLLIEADYELAKGTEHEVRKRRQLFVTQSRVLAGKVEEHFGRLFAGYRPMKVAQPAQDQDGNGQEALLDADDVVDWRSDLPQRYSELRDEHFPLFLTFDRLCDLLEGDYESGFSSARKVTYDRFIQSYWPHFPQTLTKALGKSLMPSTLQLGLMILGLTLPQIQQWCSASVIMGSEDTLDSRNVATHLDRKTYLGLSERTQSTFATQRANVYGLFEVYLARKRALQDHDAADRTHALLRNLQTQGVPGMIKLDYLYVDETQDNLLIDTLLLRSICHNPNGLFWAGDTAQTISVGSSFRFDDLKAFLYRIEEKRTLSHRGSAAHVYQARPPKAFQLTVNYRSHAGIVNCANTVISLLTSLWPYSIDVLDRERGTVDGSRPVFFTGFDSGNVEYEQFLFGDRDGSYIEFGAHQCILVRNDAARDKLREQVGDIGLIMTLYESKGLEFNDVLLYNFFEDSTVAGAQWRVVLNEVDDPKQRLTVPTFDPMRHASVCMELKFLYVAITRARNNLWIADATSKGEPMRILWTSRDQIQNCTPGSDTPKLASNSTDVEWRQQGRKLFANKNYYQAKQCFERGMEPRLAAMAEAYYLRQEARKVPDTNKRRDIDARRVAFIKAAEAFIRCARVEPDPSAQAYLRIAAECYELVGDELTAALIYRDAREFTRSTELYRKLAKFDEAVDNILTHGDVIKPEVVEKVTNVARLFYFNGHQLEKASRLFSSTDEALEYLDDRGLDMPRAQLLESLGQYTAAAEIHLEEGRTLDAIKLFLREDVRRGTECILRGLWQRVTFGVVPVVSGELEQLLRLAEKADLSMLSENDRQELSMFCCIFAEKTAEIARLGEQFEEKRDVAAALLCLDNYFRSPPKIQVLSARDVSEQLRLFSCYMRVLNWVTWADPCSHPEIGKLFGFTRAGENSFVLRASTWLNPHPTGDFMLDSTELRMLFRNKIKLRLHGRFVTENDVCMKKTRAFSPCLLYALFDGTCNRIDCPNEHLAKSQIDEEQYMYRVRICMQQIVVAGTVQFAVNDSSIKRHWIQQLYSTLYPSDYRLGSASRLDLTQIPESGQALQTVKEWIRAWVYELSFKPGAKFLSDLAMVARMAFQLDPGGAMTYLTMSPVMQLQPDMYKRRSGWDECYVIGEFFAHCEGREEACIPMGIMFVRHILMNELPIQISVLCDLLEHLCTRIVVADRMARGSPHNLTLPLSWLSNWRSVVGEGKRVISAFDLFTQSLVTLLTCLYSGERAEHLLYENRDLGMLGWRHRDVFLSRICRCYSLLAYNIPDERLRYDASRRISHLRRSDPTYRKMAMSHGYLIAENWRATVKALRRSTADSPLDELVLLYSADSPPPRPIRNVRPIVFQTIDDIPRLLGSREVRVEAKPDTTAIEVFIPEEDEEEEELIEGDSVLLPESSAAAAVPEEVVIPTIEAVQRTEEEIHKAVVIQRAFRQMLARKQAVAKQATLAAGCSAWFEACLKAAPADKVKYRVRFLGPLPHLLLCLEDASATIQEQKNRVKKGLKDARHERLEELDGHLTRITQALKRIKRTQQQLTPTSPMHDAQDVGQLKKAVNEAVELVRELAEAWTLSEGVMDVHLERAYKGIVQPRIVKPKKKPELNLDEEDLLYLW